MQAVHEGVQRLASEHGVAVWPQGVDDPIAAQPLITPTGKRAEQRLGLSTAAQGHGSSVGEKLKTAQQTDEY
jgi:hypothetical protein